MVASFSICFIVIAVIAFRYYHIYFPELHITPKIMSERWTKYRLPGYLHRRQKGAGDKALWILKINILLINFK